MKLYTKEMFLQAAKKCEVSMIDAKHIMKYIDEYVTPIELPSDEEIEENFTIYNDWGEKRKQWDKIEGAKWYREQLKKKQ